MNEEQEMSTSRGKKMNQRSNPFLTQRLNNRYQLTSCIKGLLITHRKDTTFQGNYLHLPLSSMLFILCFLLFALSLSLFVPKIYAGWGETGCAFLKIGVGARQIGMGGANVALANDVNAIYWNPAGLAQLNKREFGAMHNEWIVDFKYDFLAYIHPLKKGLIKNSFPGAIGGGLIYFNMGEFEGRDEYRNKTNPYTAHDAAGIVSYAQKVSRRLNLGVSLKYIHEKIEIEKAQGIAFDFGALYHTGIKNLNLGFTVQNLGPKMKFIEEPFSLPLVLTAGIAYTYYGLNLACDIRWQPIEERTNISLGTEYWPFKIFALRAGYLTHFLTSNLKFAPRDDVLGKFYGLGAGFGFRLGDIGIDYAFVPYGDLGNTHRISFLTKF